LKAVPESAAWRLLGRDRRRGGRSPAGARNGLRRRQAGAGRGTLVSPRPCARWREWARPQWARQAAASAPGSGCLSRDGRSRGRRVRCPVPGVPPRAQARHPGRAGQGRRGGGRLRPGAPGPPERAGAHRPAFPSTASPLPDERSTGRTRPAQPSQAVSRLQGGLGSSIQYKSRDRVGWGSIRDPVDGAGHPTPVKLQGQRTARRRPASSAVESGFARDSSVEGEISPTRP